MAASLKTLPVAHASPLTRAVGHSGIRAHLRPRTLPFHYRLSKNNLTENERDLRFEGEIGAWLGKSKQFTQAEMKP